MSEGDAENNYEYLRGLWEGGHVGGHASLLTLALQLLGVGNAIASFLTQLQHVSS